MGEWEQGPERCADCGAPLRTARIRKQGNVRIDVPLQFYIVGVEHRRRKVCPACFVTIRTAPSIRSSAIG